MSFATGTVTSGRSVLDPDPELIAARHVEE